MYTFDVFDTLITRTTATPTGIFALMQEELANNRIYQNMPIFIKENFYHLRINAEVMASHNFRKGEIEEITIAQIYEALAMNGSLSLSDRQLLIELECKIELNNSVGIIENIDKVKVLQAQGEQVVLISDMYLDKMTIKAMLVKADNIFEDIDLYVSSEYKKCKWNGKLYQLVKEQEQVEYHKWIHHGDNIAVDVEAADRLGVRTEYFKYEELTPYEKELIEQRKEDVHIQLMIGAARNARLGHQLSEAAVIGCSMGGMILFPYVWWILKQCREQGIHRLYFIARDGYVLKEIADMIIDKNEYPIRTYYIFGSRRAWRMPSVSEQNNDIDRMIQGSYMNHVSTVSELAEIFQLSVDELVEILPILKKIESYHMQSPIIRDYIKRKIEEDKENFIPYLNKKHEGKRKLIIAYLKQEIDYSDNDFAFVELAGSGMTQGCLAEMMHSFYGKPIQTFFFKLDCIKLPENCIFYDYIPSLMYLNVIIEMFARAPHGQTIGYQEDNGKIVPVFNDMESKALIEHGFREYFDGVKKFTETILSLMEYNSVKADKVDIILRYMEYITRRPDKKVMDFIGGMPNSVTGREREVVEYAPILSNKVIRALYLTRVEESIETYYKGTALEYSVLRSGEKTKKKIDFYKKNYNKLLGKVSRLPKAWKRKYQYQDHEKIFPYGIFSGRIVVYAAGKIGKKIYKEIEHRTGCSVVQWVDVKYEEYSKIGLPVSSPEKIGSIPFDYVFIAVVNEMQADHIREFLIKKGIQKDRIIWMNLSAA
ncbi:MAG: hypothetical protein WBI07_19790 [Mobilitalea sp.]